MHHASAMWCYVIIISVMRTKARYSRGTVILFIYCGHSFHILGAVPVVPSGTYIYKQDTLALHIPFAGWRAIPALGAMQKPIPDFRFAKQIIKQSLLLPLVQNLIRHLK